MVRAALAIAFALLALAACRGGDSTEEKNAAISAVMDSDVYGYVGIDLEPSVGEAGCKIPHGGPPPRDPDAEMVLNGVCRWEAQRDGDDWLVTFTEAWRPIPDNEQSHYWTYRLDSVGDVSLVDEGGAIPPQLWQ